MKRACVDRPCRQCPFRKADATPGWLGAASPERFALAILADHRLPCHLTVDYEDPAWLEAWLAGDAGQLCAGALTLMANINKVPRDQEVPRRATDKESIFANLEEFIAYHRAAPVRSWTDEEDRRGLNAWERVKGCSWAAVVILAEMDGE